MSDIYPANAPARPGSDAGPAAAQGDGQKHGRRATRLAAIGGILGAIGASTCCIVPLILFSLGISGAWVGNLTALEPLKPLFIAITLGFLGYGYWMVYRKPRECAEGAACARPLPNRLVKSALWGSTILILIALFWNWIAPIVAPILLGL